MNKDEILKMREGRKMRELLATLVMGWELYVPEAFDDRLRNYWRHPETKEARSVESWHPDENILDAFLVVDQVLHDNKDIAIRSSVRGWHVTIEAKYDDYVANAETMPLAICRAALLAIVPVTEGGV